MHGAFPCLHLLGRQFSDRPALQHFGHLLVVFQVEPLLDYPLLYVCLDLAYLLMVVGLDHGSVVERVLDGDGVGGRVMPHRLLHEGNAVSLRLGQTLCTEVAGRATPGAFGAVPAGT